MSGPAFSTPLSAEAKTVKEKGRREEAKGGKGKETGEKGPQHFSQVYTSVVSITLELGNKIFTEM